MHNFRPSPTHIPNTIKVGHTVPEICSRQKTTDGARRTDIWITKSLPELSSGETTNTECFLICTREQIFSFCERWNAWFNKAFHLSPSPHKNICTITFIICILINIHNKDSFCLIALYFKIHTILSVLFCYFSSLFFSILLFIHIE